MTTALTTGLSASYWLYEALNPVVNAVVTPAYQQARETARNAACRNHLRQISMALASHEATYSHLPSSGWGSQWVGDPDRRSGASQPGGWLFSILPFLEGSNIHSIASGLAQQEKKDALRKMLATPVGVFVCPSRRGAELRAFLGQLPLHNATKPALAFKNDYAGCGGDKRVVTGFGPPNDSPEGLAQYQWPRPDLATGVFFARSHVRNAEVTDGLSNTYFVGEKYVRLREATTPEERDFGDDQAAYIGDDRDIRRWTEQMPTRDHPQLAAWDSFGSRHPASWNALFGDGSVRSMAFSIDLEVHRALGNRRDGKPDSVP